MGNIIIDQDRNQIIFTSANHIVKKFEELTSGEQATFNAMLAMNTKYNIVVPQLITLKKATLQDSLLSIIGSDGSNVVKTIFQLVPAMAQAIQELQALLVRNFGTSFFLEKIIFDKLTNMIYINNYPGEQASSLQAVNLLDRIEKYCDDLLNNQ